MQRMVAVTSCHACAYDQQHAVQRPILLLSCAEQGLLKYHYSTGEVNLLAIHVSRNLAINPLLMPMCLLFCPACRVC